MSENQFQNTNVVGVDGSEASQQALQWAVRQAELTHAVVEAVIAWEHPQFYGLAVLPPQQPSFDGAARRVLDESVRKAVGSPPPVEIKTLVEQGSPAEVLLRAAEGAAMLVVGSRGHGGFAGALLGSVGQHCTQHAHCPVVVIRPPAR